MVEKIILLSRKNKKEKINPTWNFLNWRYRTHASHAVEVALPVQEVARGALSDLLEEENIPYSAAYLLKNINFDG